MKSRIILTLFIALALASCRKEKEAIDNTTASDNNIAENYFSDMFKVVDEVSSNTDGIRDISIGCIDTILIDTTSSPKRITIDFGTDNCTGYDLRVRKGKIHVTYTGRYRETGTVITVTPENFTVDGFLLQGTKTITNQGPDANGNIAFSINVQGSVTAPANAYTTSWNSQRTRTWVEGADTPTIWDDEYLITGSATGVNRFGESYSMTITDALRAVVGCRWIVSGRLQLTPANAETRTIDFGNGDCNGGFTVQVGNETFQILGGN
jgi:hypothetical protein